MPCQISDKLSATTILQYGKTCLGFRTQGALQAHGALFLGNEPSTTIVSIKVKYWRPTSDVQATVEQEKKVQGWKVDWVDRHVL